MNETYGDLIKVTTRAQNAEAKLARYEANTEEEAPPVASENGARSGEEEAEVEMLKHRLEQVRESYVLRDI